VTLYLIRHGETALNVARVLQPADTPLSERGRAQASALARRLRGAGLAGVLSSDLPRARQTADIVAAGCAAAVQDSAQLRERDFGDLRGRPYDTLGFDPLAMAEAPPGGESMAAFLARCARAWDELLRWQSAFGGALAVVTHGLVLRAWLQEGRIDLAGAPPPAALANTALSIVEARPPHRVHLLACTRHLAKDEDHDDRSLSGG